MDRLLEIGFQGGLNAEKYMKMTRVSIATAARDLSQMRAKRQTWSQGAGKRLALLRQRAGLEAWCGRRRVTGKS